MNNFKSLFTLTLFTAGIPLLGICGPFSNMGPYDGIGFVTALLTIPLVLILVLFWVVLSLVYYFKKSTHPHYFKNAFKITAIFVGVFYAIILGGQFISGYIEDSERREIVNKANNLIHQYNLQNAHVDDSFYYYEYGEFTNSIVLYSGKLRDDQILEFQKIEKLILKENEVVSE